MNDLSFFVPITKVDAAKRLVYGIATAEQVDHAGEICDYATTKPFYETWSGDAEKASGGKSLGNLRAMHGKIAAGKITAIAFNDDAKQIEICAKVVDDAEWRKVEEGVYTGFSQGGAYVRRWKDGDRYRYTANPSEVSLVDKPCLPGATFEMIKADGLVEERKFVTVEGNSAIEPSSSDVASLAATLAKAAGNEARWPEFIEQARDQLSKSTKLVDSAVAEEVAVAKAATEVAVDEGVAEEVVKAETLNRNSGLKQVLVPEDLEIGHVKKADALEALEKARIEEAAAENLSPVLKAIEELGVKLGAHSDAAPAVEKAAPVADTAQADVAQAGDVVAGDEASPVEDTGALAKAGARNSRSDQGKIQSMHDYACELGAKCREGENGGEVAMANAAPVEDLAKVVSERDALQKQLSDTIAAHDTAIATHAAEMALIKAAIERLGSLPVPLPVSGGAQVVSKGHEQADTTLAKGVEEELLRDPDAMARMAIKLAQQRRIPMTQRGR